MEYVPWKFDVPLFMTTDLVDMLVNSVKASIKAISNNGILLMGFCLVFVIVISIVKHFTVQSETINKGGNKK